MSVNKYDLLIIGGGPIGLCCAIEAKKKGLNYLIIEKGVLVNSIFHFPTNMTFFSTSKLLEIGDVPFISHSEKPTRREALEYFRRVVEAWEINLHTYEKAEALNKLDDGSYLLKTDKATYVTEGLILATGFYDTPRKMNVPGEDLPKVKHYYDEVHPYIGQNVLVVGAANSACDVALELFHKNAKVTMAIRKDSISPRVKYWIKPNIENRIKEGSITAYFSTTVEEIKQDYVVLNTPEGVIEIPNDFVLAMTGYQPNFDFLEKMGIAFQKDEFRTPIYNEKTLESNQPNVYLAGVITGGLYTSKYFIENTRVHAEVIVEDMLEKLVTR